MRKIPVTQIICCAVATLAISTASAQSQSDQSSSQSSSQSSGQSGTLQKAQAQEFFRASKVIGKNTQTTDNQKAGEIKEVVFNQQGEVFALVDVGNSRWAVVPWQSISPSTLKGSQNATINTTLQALRSGPAVTKDQWGALDNPNFTQGIYTYYHMQPPNTATGGAGAPGGTSQGQGSGQDQQQQQPQQPQPQEQNQSPK